MFGLGFGEILLLGILALIVIGPKQLPEVARTIGRFINELKRSTDQLKDEFKSQVRVDLQFDDYLKEKKSEPVSENPNASDGESAHSTETDQLVLPGNENLNFYSEQRPQELKISKPEETSANQEQNASQLSLLVSDEKKDDQGS